MTPHHRCVHVLFWLSLGATVLAGCASRARDGGDAVEVEAHARRWSDLDRDARMAVMTTEVMPAARRLFQAFDAERYPRVDCATCHGAASVARHEYSMPNPELYALFPTGTPEQIAMVQAYPETVRFMHNRLLPQVRDILGAETYDADTQQGFSCFSCHPRGESR